MKKFLYPLLCSLAVFLSCNSLFARPILTKSKYLIAVLSSNATGVVSPGTEKYPLVYYPDRDGESALETDYWIITDEGNGLYSFQNASTLKYISYNTSASADRTALVPVDAHAAGQSTLFTLELKKSDNLSYYIIHSAINPVKVWNKRGTQYDSLYPVGVYDGAGTSNECFIFYDSDGNSVIDDTMTNPDLPQAGGTLGIFQAYADSILFDYKTPVADTSKKEFYLSVPESQIGSDLYMNIRYKLKNAAHTLYINNKLVANPGNFYFEQASASKKQTIEIRDNAAVIASGTLYFTCLPLVQIYSESAIGSVYNQAKLIVTEPNKRSPAETLRMKIKIRGATAASMPKKAFAVKLKDTDGQTSVDRSFFGLRDDNNWILDAMYIDPSRMRNRVSTDLWNDFSVKPYYYSSEPKLINGTRGNFVEVFINDTYNGLYCMTEKVDRKQLKLKKLEANKQPAVQHGGLYKGKSWDSGTFFGNRIWDNTTHTMSVRYSNSSETWSGFEVKYPDYGDGEPVEWKPLVDALTVSSYLTNDADFRSKVAKYFDLPVFLDYYLFIELMLASDNQGKNTYLSVYDQAVSPMITISPWDCDGVWGRRWDGTSGLTGANQDFDTFISKYEHAQNNLFLRLKSLNYDDYNNKRKDRYRALRGSYFSYESLIERFTRYYELFEKSGAATREQNRWYIGNLATEMSFLSKWITNRLAYLDNQYLGGPFTGLTENNAVPSITFSPNPVQDILTVSNLVKGDKISIISMQGQVIISGQSNGEKNIINMGGYSPGIYLLKAGNKVAKIVKK